jgi:hypothetical protein
MDTVHKRSDSECYRPSSEKFQLQFPIKLPSVQMDHGLNDILSPVDNGIPTVTGRYADWAIPGPKVKVFQVNDAMSIHGLNRTENLFWILVDRIFAHERHIGLTVTHKVLKQNN